MELLRNLIKPKAVAAVRLSSRQWGPPGGGRPPCARNCYAAYVTSNNTGKVPALCTPDGPFLTEYTGCVACCEEQSHNGNGNGGGGWGGGPPPWVSWGHPPGNNPTANASLPPYLNPSFGQYLGYCNVSDVLVTYTVTATTSAAGGGGAAMSIAQSVFTTDVKLPSDFTAALQTSPTATVATAPSPSGGVPNPTSTPLNAVSSASEDRSWIAGPIVGAVLGTALVILSIAFVLYRRKKKRRATDAEGLENGGPDTGPEVQNHEYQQSSQWKNELEAQQIEKAQLHSDSMVPRATPHELEGEGGASPEEPDVERTYAELPGHGDANTLATHRDRLPHELAGGDKERLGVIGNRSELP
ncbi:hypothetical protein PG990_012516 [Apiospora arundinis]